MARRVRSSLSPLAYIAQPTSYLDPLVAFGTVAQLILVNSPTSVLDTYISFMLSVDLPVTFAQLGIPNVTDAELTEVAQLACAENETIWNMEQLVTVDAVVGALKGADAAGREYIKRSGWKKD